MLRMNAIVIVALMLLAMNGAGGAACNAKQQGRVTEATPTPPENKNATATLPTPTPTVTPERGGEETVSTEIKTLAEGQYGRVEEAFVAVARDAETYAALRGLVGELPDVKADFFDGNTVVAAFLGTRNTGGYGVTVTGSATEGIRLAEKKPQPGGFTTQALTAPFKVVSVPHVGHRTLPIEAGEPWSRALRSYQVKSSDFTSGGGFAGRTETFRLEGTLGTLRHNNLVTFAFDLKSAGAQKERALRNLATGKLATDGGVRVGRLDAGTLVDQPNDGLRATGRFTANDANLSLTFEPHPTNISDGFGGSGKLEAESRKQ